MAYSVSSGKATTVEPPRPLPGGLPVTRPADTPARVHMLTRQFLEHNGGRAEEYARYLKTSIRALDAYDGYDQTKDKNVLVTGSSGCIGSALLDVLARHAPRHVVGVGMETTRRHGNNAGGHDIEYHEIDVRNRDAIIELCGRTKPDVIFHLAAQRHPGLAERKVRETVSTNIAGTRNVLDAAIACDAERFVFASTGKAVRPHTRDVYAASKKVSEWMVAHAAAARLLPCAVARFTHVVDNGIVLDRLREWAEGDEPFRLHSPESPFYIQSALESAQLLLCSLQGCGTSEPRMFAISDLGWPVTPLDLAIGVLKEAGKEAEVEILGPQPGYEQDFYPGLYDPEFCGDVSPLFNFAESFNADTPDYAPGVDRARLTFDGAPDPAHCARDLLGGRHELSLRRKLDTLLWDLLRARLHCVPTHVLARIARVTTPHRPGMSAYHVHIDNTVRAELARRRDFDMASLAPCR